MHPYIQAIWEVPIPAKSQDTKNKSAAESMQGSSYFQTDVRQSLLFSSI